MPGREFLANSLQLVAIQPQKQQQQSQKDDSRVKAIIVIRSEPWLDEKGRAAAKSNGIRMDRVGLHRRLG